MDGFLIPSAVSAVVARGDIGHLALLLWAGFSSSLLVWSLVQLIKSNARFDDFVREIALFNQQIGGQS